MAKQKHRKTLFGLGLVALAASLAYTRLSPEQKKKLGQTKDELLEKATSQMNSASGKLKDVTDSIVEDSVQPSETVKEKIEKKTGTSQVAVDDILKTIEQKLEDVKKYLQK
ncbi:hypothetical protein ACVR1I_07175 [Streptococcus cameli]